VESSVVKQMYLRYGIDPIAGRELVPYLHLGELAVAAISAEAKFRRLVEAAMQEGAHSIETEDPATARLFFDEMGYHFDRNNDALREMLREADGVPNALYLVREERVFVFEKLVQLVAAVGMKRGDPDFQATVTRLVDVASVSPEEAIAKWKIIPTPYELEEVAGGEFAIRHKSFDARAPGLFSSKGDAEPALVSLLMGKVVPGIGEFEYRGQPMILREPMSVTGFTMEPPSIASSVDINSVWLCLERTTWHAGFSPVPEFVFREAKEREVAWKLACAGMEAIAGSLVAKLWADVDALDLGRLNDPRDVVSEDDREQVEGLRSCYPELSIVSDGALWSTYDTYQMECWHTNSWEPGRDDDFIFFLIGRLTHSLGDISLGKWVAYELSRGSRLDDAHWFACQVRFNRALADKTASRIADAMSFLERDGDATDLRGEKVSTFGDTMRVTRKFSVRPTTVTQRLSTLG
jgi:hypothetical protein